MAQQGRLGVARDIWKPLRTRASQLGAQSSVEVSGFVCRICSGAVSHVGSVGPSALERCLVSHLCPDLLGKLDGWNQITMSGLVGFGALAARARQGDAPGPPAPGQNVVAWEHLGDLGAVRKPLRQGLGSGDIRPAPISSPADTALLDAGSGNDPERVLRAEHRPPSSD